MEGALIERHLHYLLLSLNFLSLANFAFFAFLDYLSLAFAGITILLDLLIHSWTHLIHLHDSSLSFASLTAYNLRTSLSLTGLATSDPFVGYFDGLAVVALF